MDGLVTCKNEEDPIKDEGIRLFSLLYINFFLYAQGQITPKSVMVSGRNLNSFKLLCMSFSNARTKMIHSKMKGLELSQYFPIISLWRFFQMLKGSLLRNPWSDLAKFRTLYRCNRCPRYLQK